MNRIMKTTTIAALALAAGTLSALAITGPGPNPVPAPAYAAAATGALVDHSAYDQLLKKYVNAQGLVNYKGLKADEKAFNQYLELLSKNPPAADWSRGDQMAYWINAYNAYTIRLVLNYYPIKSIKDIGSKIQIPFVTTPWAAKFFTIGGNKMSLDNIEHGILRKKYHDPRIHFTLVCASISCPRLRNEAYTGGQLERQMEDQGRDFLNNPAKNRVARDESQLSKYFDWYKGDWTSNGQSVGGWVNRYSTVKVANNTKFAFLDYNWGLNEQ